MTPVNLKVGYADTEAILDALYIAGLHYRNHNREPEAEECGDVAATIRMQRRRHPEARKA